VNEAEWTQADRLAELLLEQLESLWLTEHEEAIILTAVARRLVRRSVELGEVIESEARELNDLSALQSQDLFWDANTTSSTSGWQWYLRVCGSVSSANCTATAGQGGSTIPSTQTAMLCQSDKTNPTGNDNAASFYVVYLRSCARRLAKYVNFCIPR